MSTDNGTRPPVSNPEAALIYRAIERLEAIKTDATWTYHEEIMEVRANGTMVAQSVMPPDGAHLVMFHRTIQPQLAVLYTGLNDSLQASFYTGPASHVGLATGLARAILGEAA